MLKAYVDDEGRTISPATDSALPPSRDAAIERGCLRLTEGDACSTLRFGSCGFAHHIRRFACSYSGGGAVGAGCWAEASRAASQFRLEGRGKARDGVGGDDDRFAAGFAGQFRQGLP